MKGCFILQRGFAYIGHDIAYHLKNSHGITEFCGYVYLRSSYDFLKSQTEVEYSTLLLDEDVHKDFEKEKLDTDYLNYLEREFGLPSLWPYTAVDRVLMSSQLVREYPYNQPMYTHEEMMKIFQVKARAIIKMLENEKPDFVFCGVIGSIGSVFLYHAAKKFGIPIYAALPTLIGGRNILSDTYHTFTSVDKSFRANVERLKSTSHWQEATNYIEEFRNRPTAWLKKLTPSAQAISRNKQFLFLRPFRAFRSLRALLRDIVGSFTSAERFDYSYINPWNQLRDKFARKINNLIGQDDLYDTVDPNDDYAFFPLHLEPEVALLLQAPNYADQMHVIRTIARTLPLQYKLYVKEHPQMVEYRRRSYYKELKKIPNLKLINPKITSHELIANAKLLFTITGSAGWEATILKKPIINFGRHFYNSLSQIKLCTNIDTLSGLVKEQLEKFVHNEQELIAFMAAIFEDSVDVSMHQLWEDEKDLEKKRRGIKPLADLLASKLISKQNGNAT